MPADAVSIEPSQMQNSNQIHNPVNIQLNFVGKSSEKDGRINSTVDELHTIDKDKVTPTMPVFPSGLEIHSEDPIQNGTDIQVLNCYSSDDMHAKCSDHIDISTQNMHQSQLNVSFSKKTKGEVNNKIDNLPVYGASFFKKMTSIRWKICFMCCAVVTLSLIVRQCMSMAIVCMNERSHQVEANFSLVNTSLTIMDIDEKGFYVQWDPRMEALVLSSFFYAFPLTPLLCGYLAGKFGGKYVILVQTFLMCAATLASPFVALISPSYVMGLRALTGLASGGLIPSVVQILSKWSPRLERSQMTSVVNSGQNIGHIIAFAFSGLICKIPVQGGWPFIFYIFTASGFMVILMWIFLVHDSPEVHPKADKNEIIYILQQRRSSVHQMPSPPWTKFCTSGPFWAILAAHVSNAFVYTTISTFLPLYMRNVLRYQAAKNGLLSSLPFIGRFLGDIVVGVIADKCIETNVMTTGLVRKLFQCIGTIGSAPFLVALSFLTMEQRTLAIVLFVIYWTMQSATTAAFRTNHLDIAPMYAGVISGTTLTCASAVSVVAPLVTATLTTNGTREEWQIIFFICVGIGIIGTVVFCILGSGEEQEWAKDPNLNIEHDIKRMSLTFQSPTINSSYEKGSQSEFLSESRSPALTHKPLEGVSSGLCLGANSLSPHAETSMSSQDVSVENVKDVSKSSSDLGVISIISSTKL